MSPQPIPGRATVSRQAIIDVIRAAVLGSYGVTGFADPSFRARVARWLRVDEPGIRLQLGRALRLDLFLTVAYGLPVAEVARQVDSAVRYAVGTALGRPVSRIVIHVDGLHVPADGAVPSGPAALPTGIRSRDLADSGTDVA